MHAKCKTVSPSASSALSGMLTAAMETSTAGGKLAEFASYVHACLIYLPILSRHFIEDKQCPVNAANSPASSLDVGCLIAQSCLLCGPAATNQAASLAACVFTTVSSLHQCNVGCRVYGSSPPPGHHWQCPSVGSGP